MAEISEITDTLGITWFDEEEKKPPAEEGPPGITWFDEEKEKEEPATESLLSSPEVDKAYKFAELMPEPEKEKKKIENSLILAQVMQKDPSYIYQNHDAIIDKMKELDEQTPDIGPLEAFVKSFTQSLAGKYAMVARGATAWTPFKGFGTDKLALKVSDYLESLRNPEVKKEIEQVLAGKLWPVKTGDKWYNVDTQMIPQVITNWAAQVGDQIPIMLITLGGRMGSKLIGRLVGTAIGTATLGPEPSDVVVVPALSKATEKFIEIAGTATPLIALETANYMDGAKEYDIDVDIAEKYGRFYGLGAGIIEYSQNMFMLAPFNKMGARAKKKILRRILEEAGGDVFEGVEEFTQQALQNYFTNLAIDEMKRRDPNFNAERIPITAGGGKSFLAAVGTAAITRGFGHISSTVYDKFSTHEKKQVDAAGVKPVAKIQEEVAKSYIEETRKFGSIDLKNYYGYDTTDVIKPEVKIKPEDVTKKDAKRVIKNELEGKPHGEEIEKGEAVTVLTGGLPGAGKTSGLGEIKDRLETDFVNVNADHIKEVLGNVTPEMHEKASEINKKLKDKAIKDRYNVLYDSQLTNFPLADALIKKTVERGDKVVINFGYVDPVESAARSFVRSLEDPKHRVIEPEAIIKGYNRSLPTFLELWKKWKDTPKVSFNLTYNEVPYKTDPIAIIKKNQILDQKIFDEIAKIDYNNIGEGNERRFERTEKLTEKAFKNQVRQIKERISDIIDRKRLLHPELRQAYQGIRPAVITEQQETPQRSTETETLKPTETTTQTEARAPPTEETVKVKKEQPYFAERQELAKKIEDVKLRNEVQLGKAALKKYFEGRSIAKENPRNSEGSPGPGN